MGVCLAGYPLAPRMTTDLLCCGRRWLCMGVNLDLRQDTGQLEDAIDAWGSTDDAKTAGPCTKRGAYADDRPDCERVDEAHALEVEHHLGMPAKASDRPANERHRGDVQLACHGDQSGRPLLHD